MLLRFFKKMLKRGVIKDFIGNFYEKYIYRLKLIFTNK